MNKLKKASLTVLAVLALGYVTKPVPVQAGVPVFDYARAADWIKDNWQKVQHHLETMDKWEMQAAQMVKQYEEMVRQTKQLYEQTKTMITNAKLLTQIHNYKDVFRAYEEIRDKRKAFEKQFNSIVDNLDKYVDAGCDIGNMLDFADESCPRTLDGMLRAKLSNIQKTAKEANEMMDPTKPGSPAYTMQKSTERMKANAEEMAAELAKKDDASAKQMIAILGKQIQELNGQLIQLNQLAAAQRADELHAKAQKQADSYKQDVVVGKIQNELHEARK